MNVDFNQKLQDIYGEPVLRVTDEDGNTTEMILGWVCVESLTRQIKGDEGEDGSKKMEAWEIARKLVKTGGKAPVYQTFSPSVEERKKLMDRVGKMWPVTVYANVHKLLETTDE